MAWLRWNSVSSAAKGKARPGLGSNTNGVQHTCGAQHTGWPRCSRVLCGGTSGVRTDSCAAMPWNTNMRQLANGNRRSWPAGGAAPSGKLTCDDGWAIDQLCSGWDHDCDAGQEQERGGHLVGQRAAVRREGLEMEGVVEMMAGQEGEQGRHLFWPACSKGRPRAEIAGHDNSADQGGEWPGCCQVGGAR